jgi:hypothetical protein
MRRLALALALLHAAAALADEPPWMPSAQPPPRPASLDEHVRKLRHEAALFAGVGIGLFAAGVAVDVVALDVPQGERAVPTGGGALRLEKYRNDANWAEFAVGTALLGAGFGLVVASLFRRAQARRLSE